MRTLAGIDALEPPTAGTTVTIGTFDGLHVGHRALLEVTTARAERTATTAAAVTWDRHPAATLRPERVPPLLSTLERKIELLAATGIDVLALLPFDAELSRWPPERFVRQVLAAGLGARAVVVGEGWRFGHRAAGDVTLLADLGREIGFEAEAVPLERAEGGPVSSSRVRAAVAGGDMELVRALLGRPFDVDGVVVRGDDRGAALGYPTANLAIDDGLAVPPIGVYAGRARVRGESYAAAINLGTNPTFETVAPSPRIEAYLLDFDGDLYGSTLRVEFWSRLRDEVKFDSAEALAAQIGRDVAATRELTC